MRVGYDAKRLFHNASGLGNYSRDLLRILGTYGPEHEYVLFEKRPTARADALLEIPSIRFCPLNSYPFARQLGMGKAAQKEACAIFHGLSGELPLQWERAKIKKVVTVHDLIFLHFPHYYSTFDRRMHVWKHKHAVGIADAVVAISQQTKQDLIAHLGMSPDQIQVIYQGCDPLFQQRYSSEQQLQVRKKYGLPQRFVLYVGTLEERKNAAIIPKALEGTSIPLVLVGKETAYTPTIRKAGKGLPMHFLKGVSTLELAILYQMATAFIYPSLYEGFGIPIIEALFSGTPVITNKEGVFREAGGPSSLYVNVKDPKEVRAAVLEVWEDDASVQRMASEGLLFAQQFTDQHLAGCWLDLYQSLLR